MKQKHFINFHKGITFLGILLLIAAYQQWDNPTAWVYLALHGGYGLLWVLKSYFFPDRQWEQPTNLLYGLVILVGLTTYWIAPWLLMVRSIQAPPSYLAFCVSMYIFGTFLHFASDMQKYTELKLSPEHLVNTGLWAHVRNPNYFGELLIYTGFGLLAMHWLPIAVLIAWIIFVWMPNMRKKDRSLSRYPKFASYKAHTKLFIPYIF